MVLKSLGPVHREWSGGEGGCGGSRKISDSFRPIKRSAKFWMAS